MEKQQQQVSPDFLTVGQVARRLNLSDEVVYKLIHARSLPSVRIGRLIRVSRPVLDRWLEQVDGELATG